MHRYRSRVCTVGALHLLENLAATQQRLVRAQVNLVVAVLRVLEIALLPLERPAVLVHHRGEGFGDARGEIFRASAHPEAPRVVRSIDRRMRMMDDVATLFRGDAELARRRAAQ